jgi:hypothetical protein
MPARHNWVDTNVALSSRMNAFPGGVVAWDTGSAQSGVGSTTTDITGLTVTFTAEVSRLYRTTLVIARLDQITTAGTVNATIATGANVALAVFSTSIAAGQFGNIAAVHFESGISGSTTRKGRLATTAGTVSTVYAPYLVVEDLGLA